MSVEYKIKFKSENKERILNKISIALKNNNSFKTIETNSDFINIKTEDPSSKWKDMASIETIEDGFFLTTILNRNERNFIINEIVKILSMYNINPEVEEI